MSEPAFPDYVWVVVEWPARKRSEQSIFGIYASEDAARSGYGCPAAAYGHEVLRLRVFR